MVHKLTLSLTFFGVQFSGFLLARDLRQILGQSTCNCEQQHTTLHPVVLTIKLHKGYLDLDMASSLSSSSRSAVAAHGDYLGEYLAWSCVGDPIKLLECPLSNKKLFQTETRFQCWCGFGLMGCESTPKCINNNGCPHHYCENCRIEYVGPSSGAGKKKNGPKVIEELGDFYVQADPLTAYKAPPEPQSSLTCTPVETHPLGYNAAQPASATYPSVIAGTWPPFDNESHNPPQSLNNDNSTPSRGDLFPVPISSLTSLGFPYYADGSLAPLQSCTLGDLGDSDDLYEEGVDGQPCFQKPGSVTGVQIAALHQDRDEVLMSLASRSTSTPTKGDLAPTNSANGTKRPRAPSPSTSARPMRAKSSRKVKSRRSPTEAVEHKNGRIFTCPFVWSDAVRHRSCLKLKLKRIRDVKQHLRRAHSQPYFCPRCKAVFKGGADSLEYQKHAMSEVRCPLQDQGEIPDGVTDSQFQSMGKSQQDLTKQWNHIWDIIFPNAAEARPASPFLDQRFSEEIKALVVFIQTQGPRVLTANFRLTDRNVELVLLYIQSVIDAWISGQTNQSLLHTS